MRVLKYGLAGKPGSFRYAPDNGAGASGNAGDGGKKGDDGKGSAGEGEKKFTQADLDRHIAERLTRAESKSAQALQAKISELGLTPEEVENFKKWKADSAAAEANKKKEAGKFDELIKDMQTKTQAQIQEANENATASQIRADIFLAKNTISNIVTKLGGQNIDQITSLVFGSFAVDDNDKVIVVDKDENPILDSTGKAHTPESFLQDWLFKNPHFLGSKGGGSGYRNTGNAGASGRRTYKRSELQDTTSGFYKENRADILLALKEGRIFNDIS